MANNTSLVKTILYKSLAEGVFKDVVTRSSAFYYFLGKTLSWEDENNPPLPVDSLDYEHNVRNEIITIKEIKPSDVAFVIPRRDWVAEVVYDMYDDRYCDQVVGVNVVSGGAGYININDVTLTITGGGGSGATAEVSEIVSGAIAGVVLTNPGTGYTSTPTINIVSPSGTGASLNAVIGMAASGAQKLEESRFYVVTDDYNVYKCIDNNNGTRSKNKPAGTQLDPIRTLDGYVWKFMYNIPINLRNKFYTDEYIPVVSALTNHFYSNGTIDNIFIANKGEGYSSALVSVTGDGYRESDPIYITSATIVQEGTGYTNPTIEFSPPIGVSSPFINNNNVSLGQTIYNTSSYDYYEIVTPGVLSSVQPTHRNGTVLNGTAALKFVGTKLKGSVTTRNDQNITSITVGSGGTGYLTAPTVVITDPTGTGAAATAIIGSSSIQAITVQNMGDNYVSPVLTVNGGGGQGAVLQAIVTNGHIGSVVVVNSGSGYTSSPTVIIEDSFGSGAQLNVTLSGSPILSIRVDDGGLGYSETPAITFDGGSGAGASATATVETGVIDSISLVGSVREVVIINAGSGYIKAPEVLFSGGGGQYAVARSKLYADRVISAHMVDAGDNYTSAPSVTFGTAWEQGLEVYTNDQFSSYTNLYTVIDAGVLGSTRPVHTTGVVVTSPAWVANSEVVVGQTVYTGDKMYEVMTAGLTGATAPTHTTGTVQNGQVDLRYVGIPASLRRDGVVATGYSVLRYGAGYSVNPTITFNDPYGSGAEVNFFTTKSEAKISAITENGQIIYLVIEDPGVGYTKAALTLSGDGTGGLLQADLSLGAISSQQANNEILTPSGTIDAIAVVSGGYSYGVANISIEGDGTGAAAEAVIDPLTNAITKINITSRGVGYTYANVKIVGNGNGASLRAIISPFGGHGKNSPTELFARSLMFYTNISTDLNQGVAVGNDYRQVGIIKDPRVFEGNERYQGNVGSACFIIQSPIDTTEPLIEWTASMNMVVGNYIWFDGRIYRVTVAGTGGTAGPIGTSGSEANGTARVEFIIRSNTKNIYMRFAKDDELYIERVTTPPIEWEPSLQLTIGEFIWYEDRIYTVVVSGLGSSTPPTTTTGSEVSGFAVLSYVGSTKSKKRYRIVSVSEKSALVQSLDNDVPDSNDVFIKTSSITDNFTAVSVGLPSIDKYSGQLMYIDNKQGFTPSGDETITLRTIIKF